MDLLFQKESYVIRGAVFEIYRLFRDRHKEIIYQNSLYLALKQKGLNVEKEKRINVYYENNKVGTYTPDLIINSSVLIEIKAKPKVTKEDIRQFWYYLKGSDYKLGFLINFGSSNGVEIIRRVYDTARDKEVVRSSA